jgi:hypothetical protein
VKQQIFQICTAPIYARAQCVGGTAKIVDSFQSFAERNVLVASLLRSSA